MLNILDPGAAHYSTTQFFVQLPEYPNDGRGTGTWYIRRGSCIPRNAGIVFIDLHRLFGATTTEVENL